MYYQIYKYVTLRKINLLFNIILNNNHMKTNKYFLTALGFFSGVVLTISVMGLFAFSNAPGSAGPGGEITPVSSTVANGYFKNYMAGAVSVNQVIKGFTVYKAQLDAMNNIAKENPNLPGFRIYMGRDNNANLVSIVVGVDSKGLDAVKNTIYNTFAPGNPCPPVCDVQSPIIQD